MKACFASFLVSCVLFTSPARADFEFYCDYDESPLNVGADPTVFSTTRMTDPDLDNPLFGVSISLINTATSGATTVGPQTVTKPKSNVPPNAPVWRVNNALAYPPFTATWSLSGRLQRTDLIRIGATIIPISIEDLCTVQGLVSPASGGGGGGCMIVAPTESVVSLSGEVQSSPRGAPQEPLAVKKAAEDGRQIVADEYRVVRGGAPAASGVQMASARGTPSAAVLYVRHQTAHEANANYAPAPSVTLDPAKLSRTRGLEGQRGFAIIDFGASGRVLRVHAVPVVAGPSLPQLEHEISKRARTMFQDERRHDHTAYVPYEISGGILRGTGPGLVTMPMCCGPGDRCNPRCP